MYRNGLGKQYHLTFFNMPYIHGNCHYVIMNLGTLQFNNDYVVTIFDCSEDTPAAKILLQLILANIPVHLST